MVVTRVGAPREYFGGLCHYVDPADPSDIARGVDAALEQGPPAELSAHVVKNFTWARVTSVLPVDLPNSFGSAGYASRPV